MSQARQTSYGRAAMIGALIALLLIVCVGTYLIVVRFPAVGSGVPASQDPEVRNREMARLSLLLAILLISTLLILLFVVGSYLLIHIGRALRSPVAREPTEYVDAWQQYRLSDEQVADVTGESKDNEEPPPSASDEDDRAPS